MSESEVNRAETSEYRMAVGYTKPYLLVPDRILETTETSSTYGKTKNATGDVKLLDVPHTPQKMRRIIARLQRLRRPRDHLLLRPRGPGLDGWRTETAGYD